MCNEICGKCTKCRRKNYSLFAITVKEKGGEWRKINFIWNSLIPPPKKPTWLYMPRNYLERVQQLLTLEEKRWSYSGKCRDGIRELELYLYKYRQRRY